MIWTFMGWLLASHNLFRLSVALGHLRQDQALIEAISARLASRNPYPALVAMAGSAKNSPHHDPLIAAVLAGLHQGQDLRPSLAAIAALLTIDIDQLSRQRQMTRLLLGKALSVIAVCLGFRLYFLPPSLAGLPALNGSDLLLCLSSAVMIVAALWAWRFNLPKLRGLKDRGSGYKSWLSTEATSAEQRQEGLAAQPLADRVEAELKCYRPLAEAETRSREELMGIVDLGLGGAIAASTLGTPLLGAFGEFAGTAL